MTDSPARRRWFQFRLSTWFILVGILGLAMAARPSVHLDGAARLPQSNDNYLLIGLAAGQNVWRLILTETFEYDSRVAESYVQSPYKFWLVWANADGWSSLHIGASHSLMAAILALLAFLVWKVAWLVIARRRARAAA